MTITEFLLARIAEDEAIGRDWYHRSRFGGNKVSIYPEGTGYRRIVNPHRVLAECAAKRAIIKFHESWPVFVESHPSMDMDNAQSVTHSVAFRMSREFAWATEREYRNRFGDEPPTSPIIAALAAVYADHPDYDTQWSG